MLRHESEVFDKFFVSVKDEKLRDAEAEREKRESDRVTREQEARAIARQGRIDNVAGFLKYTIAPALAVFAIGTPTAIVLKDFGHKLVTPRCVGEQIYNITEESAANGENFFKQDVDVHGGRLSYAEIPSAVYLPNGELRTDFSSGLHEGDEIHVPQACEAPLI